MDLGFEKKKNWTLIEKQLVHTSSLDKIRMHILTTLCICYHAYVLIETNLRVTNENIFVKR